MMRFESLCGAIHFASAGLRINWRHWPEEGELGAIREVADRLDGKPAQVIDRRDVVIEELSDEDLLIIASGGLSVPQKAEVLLILPPPKVKD